MIRRKIERFEQVHMAVQCEAHARRVIRLWVQRLHDRQQCSVAAVNVRAIGRRIAEDEVVIKEYAADARFTGEFIDRRELLLILAECVRIAAFGHVEWIIASRSGIENDQLQIAGNWYGVGWRKVAD